MVKFSIGAYVQDVVCDAKNPGDLLSYALRCNVGPAVLHDNMSGIRRPLSGPADHDDSTRHLPSRILPANTDSSEG